MKTEYQQSLEKWVANLTDAQLSDYMGKLNKFSDAEVDALVLEDMSRIRAA